VDSRAESALEESGAASNRACSRSEIPLGSWVSDMVSHSREPRRCVAANDSAERQQGDIAPFATIPSTPRPMIATDSASTEDAERLEAVVPVEGAVVRSVVESCS
jgi:hypothetical protein